MKKYTIEVIEELSRYVEVYAEDLDDAFEQIEEEYAMGEIVLDSFNHLLQTTLLHGTEKYIIL